MHAVASQDQPTTVPEAPHRLLRLYLRDHDAAGAAGTRLAQRAASSDRSTSFGAPLAQLQRDIEQDAASLHDIAARLDVRPDPVKRTLAQLTTVLGVLKPNGHVLRRSPLGRLYDLEALAAGVHAKRDLWASLALAAPTDARIDAAEIERLLARAAQQLEILDQLHREAVVCAFLGEA